MNALELTLVRIGFLAVLWLFVIAAVGVVRTDLFGQVSQRRRANPQWRPPTPAARPPKVSRGTPHRLLVTAGPLAGTTLGLAEQQITIGRADDATLVLSDDYASTRHARLFPQDG
ncbi:MAG: FHA domain-containing protein, partial [Actinobacteria bacterium]|nr:FHA domain-containing protein [Actinomycetota bacterium]